MILKFAILYFSMFVIVTLVSDVLLFYAGYYGHLELTCLWYVKLLVLCFCIFVMIARRRMYAGRFRVVFFSLGIIACLILLCDITYMRGDRDPFYLGMRTELTKNMDPVQLQNWAEVTLSQNKFNADIFLPRKELPPFLKINKWRPSGASIRNWDSRFIEITWGSGVAGTFGLVVGSPEFISSYGIFWKPGIYFYRSP